MAPHGLLLPARSLADLPIDKLSISAARIHHQNATITGKEARLTRHVTIATFDFDQPIVEFADIGDVAVLGSRWLGDFALTYRPHERPSSPGAPAEILSRSSDRLEHYMLPANALLTASGSMLTCPSSIRRSLAWFAGPPGAC